jgi:hypothetical protein
VEPEPLRTEPAAAGPPPPPLGYAGRADRLPAVLASGLLLAGSAAGLFGDRMTGGTTGLELWHVVLLLLAGAVLTWAGVLGLMYRLPQRRGRTLRPTSSRVVHGVRVLLHRSPGG